MKQQASKPVFFDTSEWLGKSWYRFVQPLVEKVSGIGKLNDVYTEVRRPGMGTGEFAASVLKQLDITWRLVGDLPPSGDGRGLLVVANHPTGIVESLMLVEALERIAPADWLLLSTAFIASKPEFAGRSVALDPFGMEGARDRNARGLRSAIRTLNGGGVVGVFPSGRVAGRVDAGGRGLDWAWSPQMARIARRTGARVVVLRMPLVPGMLLRCFPPRWPRARALLLAREALRHRNRDFMVRMAADPDALPHDDQEAISHLYQICHESDVS